MSGGSDRDEQDVTGQSQEGDYVAPAETDWPEVVRSMLRDQGRNARGRLAGDSGPLPEDRRPDV